MMHRDHLRRVLKVLAITIAFLLATGIGLGLALQYYLYQAENGTIPTDDQSLGIGDPGENATEYTQTLYEDADGITNIVLFGVDSTSGIGRSDAIMIVTIDTVHKKIKLSTIARDSYVPIPGYGQDKITHAYSYGGAALAIRTINTTFGLDIRHYATVNFETLPRIIDALGGVDITITAEESPKVPFTNGAGTYHMDGTMALEFMRIRKIDSDFERNRRQEDVIAAVMTKLLNRSPMTYPDLLSKIMPLMVTNLSVVDIIGLSGNVLVNGISTIEKTRWPSAYHAETINGISYIVFDIQSQRTLIGKYLFLDLP